MINTNIRDVVVDTKSAVVFPTTITECIMDKVRVPQLEAFFIVLAEISKMKEKYGNSVALNEKYRISAETIMSVKLYSNPHSAYKFMADVDKTSINICIEEDLLENAVSFAKVDSALVVKLSASLLEYLSAADSSYKAMCKLQYLLSLKTISAKKLYVMLKRFDGTGKRFTDTEWSEFLKKISCFEERYARVKERILDKAKSDINANTDIIFDYTIIEHSVQRGKRPEAIQFAIQKKTH